MATIKLQIVVTGAGPDDFVREVPHDFSNANAAHKLADRLVNYGTSQANILDAAPEAVGATPVTVARRSRK